MTRPSFIASTSMVTASEGAYPAPFDQERLSLGRDLGTAAGSQRLGAWHETLAPGRRTSFTHAHSHEEELVYVLSGTAVLSLVHPDGRTEDQALAEGDLVAFPAGTGIAHSVHNPGPEATTLLVIGERNPLDRVCYPADAAFEAWHAASRPARHWVDAPCHRGAACESSEG